MTQMLKAAKDLTVIILTSNEEIHIARVLDNLNDWCEKIIVLDSFSEDKTVAICGSYSNVEVHQRKFDNYANQRNYALRSAGIQTTWVLFVDADEYLSESLKSEIAESLDKESFDGYYLKRRFIIMGSWIKWGGYYPIWLLRLFRRDKGVYERDVNEHVAIEGPTSKLQGYFTDHNLKGMTEWWKKHIAYAQKESQLLMERRTANIRTNLWGSQSERKQWIRYKVWYRLPLYTRPFIYYIYRYFFRFGFMDGRAGFVYHLYHAFMYHFMIDNFYHELKKQQRR